MSSMLLAIGLATALPKAEAWQAGEEGQWIVRRIHSTDSRNPIPSLGVCTTDDGEVFLAADSLLRFRPPLGILDTISGPLTGFHCVARGEDGILWAGGRARLGFFRQGPRGDYEYTPLPLPTESHPSSGTPEVLAITSLGRNAAAFLTEQTLYLWDGASLRSIPHPGRHPVVLHPRSDQTWIYFEGRGLYGITANGLQPLLSHRSFPGLVTWLVTPALSTEAQLESQDNWIVGTETGVFVHRAGKWQPLTTLSETLRNTHPSAAVLLPDACFAVATQTKGILISDMEGNVVSCINGYPSLEDTQVLGLQLDKKGDLWVGTPLGISRIVSPLRCSTLLRTDGTSASQVRDMVWQDQTPYVATARGVCRIQVRADPEGRARLVPLPPTPGPVWTLASLDNRLLAGGVGGLWEWTRTEWITRLNTASAITCTTVSAQDPKRLYYAEGTKLGVLGNDMLRGQATWDLGAPIEQIVEASDGTLWISTTHRELLHLRIADTDLQRLGEFAPGKGLPARLMRLTPVQHGTHILIFTDTEILEFKEARSSFEPPPELAGMRGVSAGSTGHGRPALWMLENTALSLSSFLASVECDANGKWSISPLSSEPLAAAGANIERIFPSPVDTSVFATTSNTRTLFRLGPDALAPMPPPQPTRLVAASFLGPRRRDSAPEADSASADREESLPLPLRQATLRFPADAQKIRFEYATPGFGDGLLQTKLEPLESTWVVSGNSFREFGALGPGPYMLRVRYIDMAGRTGAELPVSFEKQAVWYRRWPAWLAYVAAATILGLTALRWRLLALRRQNESLNRKVEERTRELALANSAKMEFLASVSHEIRNPLNGIVGLVNLLDQAELGPQERQLTRSLAACARSLRRVFDDVLGFARLDDGKIELNNQPFDLAQLLEEIAAVFSAEAKQRGCQIEVRQEGRIPGLWGDGEKIRTIISNFVANALKYAPGAPIEIEASVEPAGPDACMVGIQVRDHGQGVPLEEQELIFRKFVRGRASERLHEPGAGLGLATCQALARFMGGGVGVESTPGSGAVFFLHLEMSLRPLPVEPVSVLSPPPPGENKALVIEDQEYNQLVARSILERLGYEVTLAANGEDARKAIATGSFSVVLVDWDVPGARGDALAYQIRATPRMAEATVIALTAHDSPEIRDRCIRAGMNTFLLKPLEEPMLRHTLATRRTLPPHAGQSATELRQGPHLDLSVFSYLGRQDPAQTRLAAEDYLAQLDQEQAAIQDAFAKRDLSGLASRAHRLCAHAAVVHHDTLQAMARKLQDAARAGQSDELAPQVEALLRVCTDLRSQVLGHLATI